MKSVCTALTPVVQDLRSKQGALAALRTSNDPAAVKKGLQDFISSAASDVSTVIPQLQSAGTPSVSNGSTVQSGLVSAYTQFKTALDGAASEASSLPTNDVAAFKTAATSLGANLKAAVARISASARALNTPELSAAAKAEPACTSLKT
jgi:HPt (histidine-containing phosphotransfer) domain-containing protein